MRTKHSTLGLIILLSCILLSACDGSLVPSTSQIGVTPLNTASAGLILTMNIEEDQNATDGKSKITLQFRTDVIEEDNYVHFRHGETVTCNGVSIKLNDLQQYRFPVAQRGYTCSYTGYASGIGPLAAVPLIDVAARSTLSPQQPSVSSQSYRVSYAPDAHDRACSITADAIDSSNNTVHGALEQSDLGVYTGPDTSSLTGQGTIILKRICSWTLHDQFDKISLTYQSTASVPVTWSH